MPGDAIIIHGDGTHVRRFELDRKGTKPEFPCSEQGAQTIALWLR